MTTLYFSPGSCSLVPHIALEELGIPFTAQRAPRPGADGHAEYMKNINPTGAVPALVFGRRQNHHPKRGHCGLPLWSKSGW